MGRDNKNAYTIRIVFFSLLLDLLSFTMILPLLPALLDHYKENDGHGLFSTIFQYIKNIQIFLSAPDQVSTILYGGILGSMYSFFQFLCSPIIGALSDVYGRKYLMLFCLIGIALSHLLWVLSSNFPIFVFARLIGGISKGNISLSMAIISDVTPPKTRGRAMALIGIAFSIGFTLGPMFGAWFSWMSIGSRTKNWYTLPASFASVLAFCNLIFFMFSFEESLPNKHRVKCLSTGLLGALSFVNPKDLFLFNGVSGLSVHERKQLQMLGQIYFIYLFIYSGLEFTLTFLTHYYFGFSSMQQGYMFLTIGLIMALLQAKWVRNIPLSKTKSIGELGLWLIVPAFVLIGIAPNILTLYCGILLFAVSTAIVVTCMNTLVSQVGPENQKGTITGIFRSLGALARACGPIVGSIAFWYIGSKWTYLMAAVALILPPVLLHRI
ncbi:major facilitator superfamily domain-containing protein 10 [Prorops nasuta]|uniref:major facilitator superfamily domain-containing protein 10 n=1 Tax=Prorops nasuta TaxID=863751 RepID=UPI0034CD2E72